MYFTSRSVSGDHSRHWKHSVQIEDIVQQSGNRICVYIYILQVVLFVPYTWANNISLVSFYYRLLLGFSIVESCYGARGYFWRQESIADNNMHKVVRGEASSLRLCLIRYNESALDFLLFLVFSGWLLTDLLQVKRATSVYIQCNFALAILSSFDNLLIILCPVA